MGADVGQLAGEEHIDIAVPAETAWAYRLDFSNLPEYNAAVGDVRRVADGAGPGGVLGAGAEYRFSLTVGSASHPVSLRTTEAVEGRRVAAWMDGGMSANEAFVVEPTDSGCHAVLTLWVDLPPGIPEETAASLRESGRVQIRSELDHMREVLERRHHEPPWTPSV